MNRAGKAVWALVTAVISFALFEALASPGGAVEAVAMVTAVAGLISALAVLVEALRK